jgi:hypothetical protein
MVVFKTPNAIALKPWVSKGNGEQGKEALFGVRETDDYIVENSFTIYI